MITDNLWIAVPMVLAVLVLVVWGFIEKGK